MKSKYEVIYTEKIDEKFGAFTETPSLFSKYILRKKVKIKIRPKYINDIGLLNHELKHLEQFDRDLLFNIKYTFFKYFRYKYELEAYVEQIKSYKYSNIEQCNWIIKALLSKYNLSYSEDKIKSDILIILNNNKNY